MSAKGGIIRVKKDKQYFAASNEPFNDKRLSWGARGIMGYLLSKPDGWEVHNQDLYNQTDAGRKAVDRLIRELKDNGYIHRYKGNDDQGHLTWITEVYECASLNPHCNNVSSPTVPFANVRSPNVRLPNVRKRDDIVSTDIVSTDESSTDNKKGIPSGADAPAPNGNGHLPTTFQDWLSLISEPPDGSNEVAQLRTMYQSLYPGRAAPSFGRIGTAKQRVGGAPRLAQLLWETATRPPVGEVLSYIEAIARGKRRDSGSDRAVQF